MEDLKDDQKSSIRAELREQIACMRSCTQPFIGRLGNRAMISPYEPFGTNNYGPFSDEEKFDEWCLKRLHCSSLSEGNCRGWLERKRRRSSGKFVQTHGDLSLKQVLEPCPKDRLKFTSMVEDKLCCGWHSSYLCCSLFPVWQPRRMDLRGQNNDRLAVPKY